MKTKLIPILIIFLLVIVLGINVVSAGPAEDCNNAGGIYCYQGNNVYVCHHSNDLPIDCEIDSNQTVIVSGPSGVEYQFNNLNLGSDLTIQFYQSTPSNFRYRELNNCNPPLVAANCHEKSSCSGAGEGAYGESGEKIGKCYGGNGGGGGAGGIMLEPGSNGGKGADGGKGEQYRENCAYGSEAKAGRAGANVTIIVKGNLISTESTLSVSGENGANGANGTNRKKGCGSESVATGAVGGAGGGGAGAIYLISPKCQGSVNILANGGNGGRGGNYNSSVSDKRASGGAGAGGGGGNSGAIYVSSSIESNIKPSLSVGKEGLHGKLRSKDSNCYGSSPDDCNGKSGSVTFSSIFILNEVDNANSNANIDCNDKIDNDNDYFKDFEDVDCYGLNQEDTGWDLNGPISFSSYDNLLGINKTDMETDLGISWWDPSSSTAYDGVCGDDKKTNNCQSKTECSVNNCNETLCKVTRAFKSCMGPTIKCSNYEDYNGHCLNAPSFCKTNTVCLDGQDIGCSQDTYECDGVATCSDLGEQDCNDIDICTPNYVITSCEQNINCEEQTNQDDCNSNYCNWFEKTSTDLGFVTPDKKRYFCSNDFFTYPPGVDKAPKIVVPSSGESQWHWWDAFAQSSSFKTHILGNNDFISNGESWFVCNATGTVVNQNANSIEKDSTFDTATANGEYLCSTILNTLKPFFNSCTEGNNVFGNDPNWTSFSDELSNDGNKYYCKSEEGKLASQEISAYFDDAVQGCLNLCGKGTPYNPNAFQKLKSSGSNTGGLLKEACGNDALTKLHTEFCKIYPCNDNGLSANFGGTSADPGLNGEFFDVDSCGYNMESCLGGLSTAGYGNCTDIKYLNNNLNYKGFLCGEEYGDYNKHYYCASGKSVYSADLFSVDENGDPKNPYGSTCCVDAFDKAGKNVCQPIPDGDLTQKNCEDSGGKYLPTTENINDYYCDPFADNANGRCCFGKDWKSKFKKGYNFGLTQNTSFICYKESGKNRLAECCTDFAPCNNKESDGLGSFFGDDNDYLHGYYGKGGVLHTLRNFDGTNENNKYTNYFYRFTPVEESDFSPSDGSILDSSSVLGFKERGLYNWSTFDYLEFDIAYNILAISQDKTANNLEIHLVDKDENVCNFSITNYSTSGYMPLRWHHIVLPLKECENINFSNVKKILFSVKDNKHNEVKLGVDNFYLSENETKENSDNFYCTGNFATWIKNLDGETPEGFSVADNLTEYGPYMYACESQASYGWTGRRCCGDQTKTSDYWTDNDGEYFNDTLSGCFHGTTVYQNTRVSDVLNDPRLSNLLFYNGAFQACINGSVNGVLKKESFNASSDTGNNLVSKTVPAFTVVGNFICDQSGYWINKESYSVSRIIASKMYNLSSDKNKYTIFCESPDQATNLNLSDKLPETNAFIKDFCTLQYYDSSNKVHTLIGLGFKNTSVSGFLTSITSYLNSFYFDSNKISEEELLKFPLACDGIEAGSTNNNNFFSTCDTTKINKLGILYNPDFNILFIAQDISNPLEDFNGIFKDGATTRDYIQHYWNAFINIFKKWFGFGDQGGSNINWTDETVLPLFSNATSRYNEHLQAYVENTPVSGKVVNMDKLFVKKNGGKRIDGFKENLYYNTQKDKKWFITLEYVGFNKSVKYLAEQFFSGDKYELQYAKSGSKTQIIQIVNPKKHGNNLEGEEKTFEPDFTWQRLGPLIYFSDDISSNPLGYKSDDDVADLGEWCVYNDGKPVYKYRNNTCEFWGNYTSGNVTCNSDGTLNYDDCIFNP